MYTLFIGLSAIAVVGIALYLAFLIILATPVFQDHAIYLHRVTLTGSRDVNMPEQWGFLRNQVTPFQLTTPDGQTLHAWHIMPLDTYRNNETELNLEPTGLCHDIKERRGFKLLKNDPGSHMVIYLHGASARNCQAFLARLVNHSMIVNSSFFF